MTITLSAQIAVAPLLIFHFHGFSLVSPLTNMLIAPLIPLAMLLSFLSVLFGKIIGFFAYIILKLCIQIADFGAKIPYAHIETRSWISILALLLFVVILLYFKRKDIFKNL